MKKLYSFIYYFAAILFTVGLLYFFFHIMFAGNVWQSISAFAIGATVSALIIALVVTAHNAEENMYEVAVANLQKQVNDAENNYDLMRAANQSLFNQNKILEDDVNRQAGIIAEMATKNSALFLELDQLKAERVRLTMGTSKIDPKGKIV